VVLAYHLIWVAYGWWLPNDLRGSMSKEIASDVIADLGALHYGRKKVQPASRDIRAFYQRAKAILKFPLLTFAPPEIDAIAHAFSDVIRTERYTCYACAILRDHVHLILRKHKHLAEEMIANLQEASHEAVLNVELRHFDHPVWGGPGWKVFFDSTDDIWRTIPYVEDNPVKAGHPIQKFPFVTPYDNWPLRERRNV
jgi:REP element-mobilizing transposase RayT